MALSPLIAANPAELAEWLLETMKHSIGILLVGAGLLRGEQLAPVAPGVPRERGGEVHTR